MTIKDDPSIVREGAASHTPDWFVWSFEHNAWWGPNRCGYYTELRAAGLYTEQEAKQIVEDANRGSKWKNEEARHISTQAEHIHYALGRYELLAAALKKAAGR